MNAAVVLADLEELDRFLVALDQRQRHGDHICLAEQPETVNGSPETLVEDAVAEGARITGGWAGEVVAALEGKSTTADISRAIALAGDAFELEPFALLAEEQILRGLMLGALDSQWERTSDVEIAPARFRDEKVAPTVYAPFTRAIEAFEQKQVLPPAAFGKLQAEAKLKSFTVARLAKEELLAATHAELLKRIKEGRSTEGGPNLRDFQRFAKERLESAGWTPANRSHVETIYRTNIVGAYQGGRALEMSQPSVLAAMPYWQIRGVTDARQREAHRRAHGIVLPANHPFWRTAYPPFGWNCRCRATARTAAYLKANGLTVGPVPSGLPDPGFESGTRALIQVPAQLLQKPPANVAPAPVPAPTPLPLPPLPLPPPPAPPLPPPPPAPLPPPRLPVLPAEVDLLAKKVADASGSNPGGIYIGSDGVTRYVKFYQDSAQAAGEHLANSIYTDLGLAGPTSQIFVHEGKLAYASTIVPKVKTLGEKLSPELAKKALDGFAADVLMANWDAAGLTLDNMLVDTKGRIIRIDNGAAFLTRAQGARKPLELLGRVTEWETLLDPTKNPGYAKLAHVAGVTSPADMAASLKRGINKILKLRDESGGWRAYVEARAAGLSVADRQQIIGMLEARTTFLEQRLEGLKKLGRKARGARTIEKLEATKLPSEQGRTGLQVPRAQYRREADRRLRMLTSEERKAIVDYTGTDYGKMRDAQTMTMEQWVDKHAKTTGFMGPSDYAAYQRKAELIEQSYRKLAAVPGPEAGYTELYRGMRNMPKELVDKIINATSFEWNAMTSASWRPDVPEESFSGFVRGKNYGVVFVMKPHPSQAIRKIGVETISQVGGEGEALLQRGSRFRVTEVKRQEGEGRIIVYAEELEEGAPGGRRPIQLVA